MNSCSLSHDSIRWLPGTNPSACTASSGMNVTSQNLTTLVGYNATFTNTSTNAVTTYPMTAGTVNLGCLPVGPYTVSISKRNGNILLAFGYNNNFVTGNSATFNIASGTTTATVTIDYAY
jgi:hypothetical protein